MPPRPDLSPGDFSSEGDWSRSGSEGELPRPRMPATITLSPASSRQYADLIARLEAATARLEDIASSTIELPQAVPALQQTIASPQSGVSSASTPAAPTPAAPAEPLPESIEEFDSFVESSVGKYVKLSGQLGGLVAEQVGFPVKPEQSHSCPSDIPHT